MITFLTKAFLQLLDLILSIYIWLIIARTIISWVNPSPYHPVVRFLYKTTEPVLGPVRKLIPPLTGLDLSPVVVIFLIYLFKNLIHYIVVKYLIF